MPAKGGGALRPNEDRDKMFDEPVKTELHLADIKPAEEDETVVRLVAWSRRDGVADGGAIGGTMADGGAAGGTVTIGGASVRGSELS
ncbi:phosphate:acyl [Sesbania bispinosa]|nr:phosphate:acyl [Sesbania bispinosa]